MDQTYKHNGVLLSRWTQPPQGLQMGTSIIAPSKPGYGASLYVGEELNNTPGMEQRLSRSGLPSAP